MLLVSLGVPLLLLSTVSPAAAWRLLGDRRLGEAPADEDDTLPSNCNLEKVGCFKDGCDGADCRSLQYGVDGCSGQGTTPGPSPSPTCDQPSLTNELCTTYCYQWFKEDLVFGATNNGECYCSTDYEVGAESNGLCDVECPSVEEDTGCNLPCNGARCQASH